MSQVSDRQPDLQWSTLIPTIILTSLASVVVLLRLTTRCFIVKSVGFDDWVILLCLVLSWSVCGLTAAQVAQGIGGYTWTRPLDLHPSNAKLVLAWNCLYIALINVTKASILLQYLRIFSSQKMRMVTFALLAALLPALLWGVFRGIFTCNPVEKLWKPKLPGHCKDTRGYWISTATVNIVLDFLVFLVPLGPITRLHLPRKQKWALVLVFLIGFLYETHPPYTYKDEKTIMLTLIFSVCAVSLVRVALVHVAFAHHNWTDSSIAAFTWSSVEANTGIICASLLALKPLLLKLFPRLMNEERPPRHSTTLSVIPDLGNGPSFGGLGLFGLGSSDRTARGAFRLDSAYVEEEKDMNTGQGHVEDMPDEDALTLVGSMSRSECSSADSITPPRPVALLPQGLPEIIRRDFWEHPVTAADSVEEAGRTDSVV